MPLYIQIVQGRTSAATSVAMMPFMLTVFFTAILIVRLYDRFTPRQIARAAFALVAAGTLWLAFVVRNDWSTPPVILGLIIVGLGQGALVTLLFNVLVTSAPKELAGDVGSLRGVTQNLAAAVGTAVVGALVVGVLSAGVMRQRDGEPAHHAGDEGGGRSRQHQLPEQRPLKERFESTTATPEQVAEAVRINTETRTPGAQDRLPRPGAPGPAGDRPGGWLPDYGPARCRATSRRPWRSAPGRRHRPRPKGARDPATRARRRADTHRTSSLTDAQRGRRWSR